MENKFVRLFVVIKINDNNNNNNFEMDQILKQLQSIYRHIYREYLI